MALERLTLGVARQKTKPSGATKVGVLTSTFGRQKRGKEARGGVRDSGRAGEHELFQTYSGDGEVRLSLTVASFQVP